MYASDNQRFVETHPLPGEWGDIAEVADGVGLRLQPIGTANIGFLLLFRKFAC